MAKQRFARMWGHGYLGLLRRHEYEVVGSNNRSILYLGKQAESYKVMIYAPPCLRYDGCRRCSRSQSRNISESNRESAEEGNTGKQTTNMLSITMEQLRHEQANTIGLSMMHVILIAWHEREVVGSSKRSILYLGKQAESYKVMIYAPPCLRNWRLPKV